MDILLVTTQGNVYHGSFIFWGPARTAAALALGTQRMHTASGFRTPKKTLDDEAAKDKQEESGLPGSWIRQSTCAHLLADCL